MKNIKLFYAGFAALCLSSCAKENVADFEISKPDTVSVVEQLNSYGVLLDYVDQSFKLGNTITPQDFNQNGTAVTVTKSNFNELVLSDFFVHSKRVNGEGVIDSVSTDVLLAVEAAKESGLSVYGQSLLSADINSGYLQGQLPGVMQEDLLCNYDFEDKSLGDTYPIACNGAAETGTAEVVNDPDNESGKCLYVKCGLAMPVITVTLPDGHRLDECTRIEFDYYAVNEGAVKGFAGAFHVRVNENGDATAADYPTPVDQGCEQGKWGRGKMNLDVAKLLTQLTDEQKALSSIPLEIGPVDWGVEFYIDNIKFYYAYNVADYGSSVAKKFAENEISRYVQTIVKNNSEIKVWTVAENPVSSSADMFWKKVLGTNYVGVAAKYARQADGSLKLFVSETNLEDADCRAALLSIVKSVSEVDGINVVAALNDNSDFSQVFTDLASSGKAVRFNVLSFASPESLTKALTAYMTIPQAQRYGISFANVNGVWGTDYNRTELYKQICEILKNK